MGDTFRRHGKCLEPFLRNEVAVTADDALAVDPAIESIEGSVDFVDLLACLRGQREITISFDSERVAFAGLFVELDVARFTIGHQRSSFGRQGFGIVRVTLPFGDELVAPGGEPRVVGQELGLVLLCGH